MALFDVWRHGPRGFLAWSAHVAGGVVCRRWSKALDSDVDRTLGLLLLRKKASCLRLSQLSSLSKLVSFFCLGVVAAELLLLLWNQKEKLPRFGVFPSGVSCSGGPGPSRKGRRVRNVIRGGTGGRMERPSTDRLDGERD